MEKYETWNWEQQQQYENDLDILYSHSVQEGLENNYSEDVATNGVGRYSELTRNGVENMILVLRKYFENDNGVFYDLGSGTGKLATHVALGTNISKVYGYEYDPIRYKKSIKLLESIDFPNAKPKFINGNFFDYDLSDATIIYFDNTMFYDYMQQNPLSYEILLSNFKQNTVIITKYQIPCINGITKQIKLQSSSGRHHGFYTIFESFSLDKNG